MQISILDRFGFAVAKRDSHDTATWT